MASVTLLRPSRHTVLRSFAGHLEKPPAEVFPALLDRLAALDGVDADHLVADPAERFAVVQGDWWYRGEYRVRAADAGADAGSVVEYEIVNVAPTWHWAGPVAGRGVIRSAPADFQAVLSELAR
ncbi:MAG: hypothetical protein EPO52_14865 [Herbiconiux sp.]|uniref:hypothetical protein n=1 Tax=Herbiconiux sp. TaxID=1871186 RepID=UPI001202AB41|nr:hypothetical protein [Herbiconiux sp.]TAJ46816.1 MAG: hypothetical protein EPO52_14865 [Herbiconiux sp.]